MERVHLSFDQVNINIETHLGVRVRKTLKLLSFPMRKREIPGDERGKYPATTSKHIPDFLNGRKKCENVKQKLIS